jgi:hypothetical protein
VEPRQAAVWDGITRSDSLIEEDVDNRKLLFETAKSRRWAQLLIVLSEQPKLVNITCPDDSSFETFLHCAAREGAEVEVVHRLVELGAWRTMRDKAGDRPVEIARDMGFEHLSPILEPVFRIQVPLSILQQIQRHFHEIIRSRSKGLVERYSLRLPELEPLLELDAPDVWFAVPGMYGGFHYWLELDGHEAKLVTEHWSRIVGGSGERHEIAAEGSVLVAKGFV